MTQQPRSRKRSTPADTAGGDIALVRALASLLQRLEASKVRVAAGQYRAVALQLAQALAGMRADGELHALLDAHPAAAELYENQNYPHAGLCRCPLELALWSEFLAREVLHKAALRARERPLGSNG
jgi:hypothetical protein